MTDEQVSGIDQAIKNIAEVEHSARFLHAEGVDVSFMVWPLFNEVNRLLGVVRFIAESNARLLKALNAFKIEGDL